MIVSFDSKKEAEPTCLFHNFKHRFSKEINGISGYFRGLIRSVIDVRLGILLKISLFGVNFLGDLFELDSGKYFADKRIAQMPGIL